MDRLDFPYNSNPSYFPEVTKQWTAEVANIEGEGRWNGDEYIEEPNLVVTYWLSGDQSEIEISNIRAVGVDIQPSERELKEMALTYFQCYYNHRIKLI